MTNNNKAKVLVIGATGNQGGGVMRALLRAGHPVTAFVLDPSEAPAQALAEQGVALAVGNLDDVASLEAAVAGHDVVFSLLMPNEPGVEARQAADLVALAKRAGVSQIVHSSVSATGWRNGEHSATEDILRTSKSYWDGKEGAEEAIRKSGLDYWTIVKPALFMENFLPTRRDIQFNVVTERELVLSTSPDTVMALTNADDLGAAVAAAVADPDKFQHAEIDLAGDALTFPDIVDTLSASSGRELSVAFISRDEQAGRLAPRFGDLAEVLADSQEWQGRVGYPARPDHAAAYGLPTTTLKQWAAKQTWDVPSA
ncbi:NmrA/HSCARG family protein [Nocardioides korecus]